MLKDSFEEHKNSRGFGVLGFWGWKFAWNHESPQNAIVFVNWTSLTVLERKTPNSPKIYAKHKIGPTKNCFAWFWATFAFLLFGMKKCFLSWKGCLMSWKFAWNHESLQNAIVLVNRTWITVLERKTPNSPKICAKHKIGSTNIRFAKFWATFVFGMKKCFMGAHRENTGSIQGKHMEHTLSMHWT